MKNKTTEELEIEVSDGRIIEASVMPDGKCKLVVVKNDDVFVKVEASKLSFEDEFMKYQPFLSAEKDLKEKIKIVIQNNPKDFWRPKYDPSFDEAGTGICYMPGKMPAINKSYNWWVKVAKEFNPDRKSRLGTKSEYIAFLAVLIKELVASGKSVEWAWNAVCNDSKELGHYRNSKDSENDFEPTGSREICGWYDLANTTKILSEDKKATCFWIASGNYYMRMPLAHLKYNHDRDSDRFSGCGWIVLEY